MKNHLFVIGIDEYTHAKINNLSNCVKDVRDFSDILLDKYPFESQDLIELINKDATNINIQNNFKKLAKEIDAKDSLIIFYSGHGYFDEVENVGYWIPSDANHDFTTWINNRTILDLLTNINCKHLVLIVDSCFSHSLLLTDIPKSNLEYSSRSSRWALVSAFNESWTSSDPQKNSEFAKSIIEFLETEENEFRFSQLIEHVKSEFNQNVLQSPQGYPLRLNGHKGGEFIFKIEEQLDQRDLKGYSNFLKVLKLYRNNVEFKEIKKFEDKRSKIGYQIYREYDQIVKRVTYFIYLYSGTIQTKNLNHIKISAPEVIKSSNFIIFIQKEQNQIDPQRKIVNINNKFKPVNTFYIDEFIREISSRIIDKYKSEESFLQISNFIIPTFKSNGVEFANNHKGNEIEKYIDDWSKKNESPILIVKGTGGIGKTTFAQYIIDRILKDNKNVIPLFIDSVLFKDNLIKEYRKYNKLNLYNFYEAVFSESSEVEKLNEDQFNLNLDAGNFLVVIDGLDEIISKIPGFKVDLFLSSIFEITDNLGGGKVVITCRTHFWNTDFPHTNFKVIELSPFNKEQANLFFEGSLNNSKKRIKALELADDFTFSENSDKYIYHPYILDIIRSIFELEQDAMNLDLTTFNSNKLNPKIKNDYIVFRVCDRERKRIGQISVDDQINFFKHLANNNGGILKLKFLDKELKRITNNQIDTVNIEAFKAHPLLAIFNFSVTFKYDFFSEIFRAIEVAEYFNFNSFTSKIPNNIINILNENCWFDSGLNIEVSKRIESWDEEDHLFISLLIDQILKSDYQTKEIRNNAVGNIFNIALRINHIHHQNNKEENTKLLKVLFSGGFNSISNLRIVNLSSDRQIRFDFSDLEIKGAIIENYQGFYECEFNENSRFIESVLFNLTDSHAKVNGKIFINCTYDKNIEEAIKNYEETIADKSTKLKVFLNSFFHLFFSNGRLGRQWEEKVIKPRFNGVDKHDIGYAKVIRVLKRTGLLESQMEKEGVKMFISEGYKDQVTKFVKDGTMSSTIAQAIELLK